MALRIARRGNHVGVITIDRPERRNALDRETLDGLQAAITGADLRVMVLCGAGGHFCSGADLTEVEDRGFVDRLGRVLRALREAPFPVIAAVDGAALGAGTQLAIACDLRTAAPTAKFGIPAAKLGLMVDQWTVQRLALIAGQGAARSMLLAADVLSGDDAFRLGLAQRLGPVEIALEWADEIATRAPLTIAGHKLMLNQVDQPVPPSTAVGDTFAQVWASEDLSEGLAAFRERRQPEFGGR